MVESAALGAWEMAHFASQTPEANATSLLGGPGPASLVVGGAAWREVYFELVEARRTFKDALRLLLQWTGPAAIEMTRAANGYLIWMHDTINSVGVIANQMLCIAEAYAAAQLKIVAPGRIAKNRAQLQELIASDRFGENAEAITAMEAEYEQYRVQNAEVMFRYANEATAAMSQVLPFAADHP
ncbi:PPE family protein [Mycobacterium haemophilum]|uniref:PPE family protein n=1 Tax=Mycobacterium haemophilum TaxID=29311 RepID=UPI0021F344C6|nr:PPE family protein [Mycobacterium haemophilum]MCV7341479.1 PPE family protein [Mycobacterium haemophilum DSM 44634]